MSHKWAEHVCFRGAPWATRLGFRQRDWCRWDCRCGCWGGTAPCAGPSRARGHPRHCAAAAKHTSTVRSWCSTPSCDLLVTLLYVHDDCRATITSASDRHCLGGCSPARGQSLGWSMFCAQHRTASAVTLRCLSPLPVAMRLRGLGLPTSPWMVTDRPSAGLPGESAVCARVCRRGGSASFDTLTSHSRDPIAAPW